MYFAPKRLLFSFFALCLFLAACGNKEARHTASRDHAIIDSMVAARLDDVNQKVMEDLDYRMSIEVKQKADSIVAARLAANNQPAQ